MKRVLLVAGILTGLVILASAYFLVQKRKADKALSPEGRVVFNEGGLNLAVIYNRPYKKGRQIFGGLVPFGKLWRTGANEATVFATSENVMIGGKEIEKGRYQLITIPNPDKWTIILNADVPGWGIDQSTGNVYRNRKEDVLEVDVPATKLPSSTEQFTVSFAKTNDGVELLLQWDSTRVSVPITRPGLKLE